MAARPLWTVHCAGSLLGKVRLNKAFRFEKRTFVRVFSHLKPDTVLTAVIDQFTPLWVRSTNRLVFV